MAKTGKVFSKKELTEALKEMVEVMVLEDAGRPVEPSGDFEKLKMQIAEACQVITEDDEFSDTTADVIEWVLDNLEPDKAVLEDVPDEKQANASGTTKKVEEKSAKLPKEKKEVQKRSSSSERLTFLAHLIAESKWTRKDLVEKAMAQFPSISKDAIQTILSDGKNPKYNRFDALIVEQENGVMSFEAKK